MLKITAAILILVGCVTHPQVTDFAGNLVKCYENPSQALYNLGSLLNLLKSNLRCFKLKYLKHHENTMEN